MTNGRNVEAAQTSDTAQAGRPGVLWVGRMIFGEQYRVREVELAQRLVDRARLYALDHTRVMTRPRAGLADKLRLRLELFRSPFEVLREGAITRFRMPLLASTGPTFCEAAAEWNARRLQDALERFDCDRAFISMPFFFMPPRRRDYHVHYDVIDNYHDMWPNTRVGRARREFHREQLRRADTVSASSLQLCDYVKRLADRPAIYIPNGAPQAELRAVPQSAAREVRERFGLHDRFVVGFIGNHTQTYYGMERITRAFAQAREQRPELALLVVGPGGERALEFCKGAEDGVYVAGGVSPEQVGAYFQACDAGVHPYDPRPQTHDAMALNVIEFAACGKPVLSNPLKEFLRLKLPNVRFTDSAEVRDWATALADPASFGPFDERALEAAIELFDWAKSADKLWRVLNGEGHGAP